MLGAQLYTVREFTQTAEGLEKSLEKVAAIGYKNVQLSAHGKDIDPVFIRDALQKNNLVCHATHISFTDMQENLDKVMADHRLWNCPYIGVGAMPREYWNDAEGFAAFAKAANEVAEKLHDNGFTFIYHNHDFEFQRFDGKLGLDILFDHFNQYAQFEVDTYWVQSGGGDVCKYVRKMAGRMDIIHFKDMIMTGERKQTMAEIGYGNLNWDAILPIVNEIGVKDAFVEQDICARDPFESLKMSFDFLTGKGFK